MDKNMTFMTQCIMCTMSYWTYRLAQKVG